MVIFFTCDYYSDKLGSKVSIWRQFARISVLVLIVSSHDTFLCTQKMRILQQNDIFSSENFENLKIFSKMNLIPGFDFIKIFYLCYSIWLTIFPRKCLTVPLLRSSASRSVNIQPTGRIPTASANRFTWPSKGSSSNSSTFLLLFYNQ